MGGLRKILKINYYKINKINHSKLYQGTNIWSIMLKVKGFDSWAWQR